MHPLRLFFKKIVSLQTLHRFAPIGCFGRYNRRPALLREELGILSENELVVIDKIQKIPAFTRSVKRRVIQSLKPGSPEFGHALEYFIIQEIIAYIGYFRSQQNLSYWHTYSDYKVDAIVGTVRVSFFLLQITKVWCPFFDTSNRPRPTL